MTWGIFIILLLLTYAIIRVHDFDVWLRQKVYQLDHKEEGEEDAEIQKR